MDGCTLSPPLFTFLRELAKNNDKEWFTVNKKRYEAEVLFPILEFIKGMQAPLAEVSPYLTANPKRMGGSLFRIYRDVRFSKDKSPYKTHAGIVFYHQHGDKKGGSPGIYLHLEPDGCFAASGVHCTQASQVAPIRRLIVEKPQAWEAVLQELEEKKLELGGDSLKTAPRGFDRNHPYIKDIKRKDFYAHIGLREADVVKKDFPHKLAAFAQEASALNAFLARAMELPW